MTTQESSQVSAGNPAYASDYNKLYRDLTANDMTIAGVKTFSSKPVLPASAGSGNEAARITDVLAAFPYAATDDLLLANATEQFNQVASYTLIKSSTVGTGTFRIKFDIKHSGAAGTNAYGKIYRNGVAVGTERVKPSSVYETFSEDIAGWTNGDTCQIYAKCDNAADAAYIKNLDVYGKIGSFAAVT